MRQFIAPSFPDADGHIPLASADFRYLHQVLRLTAGDSVPVRLPDSTLTDMTFRIDAHDAGVLVCANPRRPEHSEEAYHHCVFTLFQILPKPPRMDTIVRQMTECGVAVVVPVLGRFSPPQAGDGARLMRWQKLVREARQQSGSALETTVLSPRSVSDALVWWCDYTADKGAVLPLLLDEHDGDDTATLQTRVANAGTDTAAYDAAACVVGCEGGIASEERDLFSDAGFLPIHLKTNILRVDTAALYGMAALQTAIRENEQWQSNVSIS